MVRRGFLVASVLTLALAANLQAAGSINLHPGQAEAALAPTRAFNNGINEITDFVNSLGPAITPVVIPTDFANAGSIRYDAVTAQKICEFAGYATVQSMTLGHWYSCGDNHLAYWNGSQFVWTYRNACALGNNRLDYLVCANPMQCNDGVDNDSDGATDYPNDFSCSSATDNDETNAKAQCQDGADNDADGATDYPADFSCSSKQDNDETNVKSQCQDGADNDSDGLMDYPNDPGCQNKQDNDETGGTQCSDGIDNDGDGATDSADFSCASATDNDETNPKAACQDNADNDGDGLIDLSDGGCNSLQDNDETGGSSVICGSASFNAASGTLQAQGWTPLTPGSLQSVTGPVSENGITYLRITDNSTTQGLRTEYPTITDGMLADREWTLDMKARILSSNANGYVVGMNMLLTSPSGKYASIYIDTNKFGPLGPSLSQYEYARIANTTTADGTFHTFTIAYHRNGVGVNDDTFDIRLDGTTVLSGVTRNELWNSAAAGQNINGISFGIGSSPGTGSMDVASITFRNTESFCPAAAQCSDGLDNDNDGATDLADFSCSSSTDTDETNPKAACQDGIDNDGDGQTDFPNDAGCSSRQDNDETGGNPSICAEGSQVLASIYSAVNGGGDVYSLNQSRTTALCNSSDLLLAGAGTGPSCDNASSPACSQEMHYEFNSYNPQGQQNGWTANYSVPGDAFYDTVRAEARCVPNTTVTTKYFSTYVRTSGLITNYYALNQNKNTAYCDPGDIAIHGGGTNVFCDGPGNGGCGIQMLEFNGRIIDGNREGWVANYSMPGDATYDTIQTTVVCLKKTSLFDQALRVYHVVNEANPVDYYSLNQNRTEALCNTGDIAIGGGGSAAYCDNASNPACNRIQYLEFNGMVTSGGRQGWKTAFDLGGDSIYDTQRVAVTCLGLANSCTGGGGSQCSDGLDNDNDGATDLADFSCSSSTDTDETNPKAACQDGIDNDGDGQTDFPNDAGCSSRQDNDEGGGGSNAQCNDLADNDGDGLVDIADPGCHYDFNRFNVASYNPNGASESSNQGKGTCADGVDNNGNFLIDAFDASCHTDGNTANTSSFDPSRNETGSTGGNAQCNDSTDNDGDGLIDTNDPGCHSDFNRYNSASYNPNGTSEASNQGKASCADGYDNNGNGQIDAQDPVCHTDGNAGNTASFDPNRSETGTTVTQCQDGIDNDGDGATDLADFSCSGGGDNDETNPKAACQDGIDNDGDGQTDFPNDAGCSSRQDNDEGSAGDAATDLSVTMTGPSSITKGSSVTYTATVTNNGPAAATNVRLTDPPAGFTFVPGSSTSSCVQSGNAVVCTLATLAAGSSQTFTLTFSTQNSSCNISVTDIATVTANNPDPNPTNNQSQSVVTFVNCQSGGGNQCADGVDNDSDGLTDSADPDCHTDGNPQNGSSFDGTRNETTANGGNDGCLDIAIEDDRDPAEPGDNVEYDITVENTCSSSRTFTLVAELDHDMDFENASGNGDDTSDHEVEWRNVTIAAGDDREFTVEVELDDGLEDGDKVEVEARIGSNSERERTDIEEDGGSGGSTGGNVNGELLSVGKTSDRSTAQPGDTVVYSINIRNSGNRSADNVVVEDQFNAGQLSILDPAGGTVNGSTIRWVLDRVDANTTRTLRYTARISGGMRHGDIVQNNVRLNGGSATASASNVIRIIQQLPQTGAGRMGGNSTTLRTVPTAPATHSNASPVVAMLSWLTTIAVGGSIGSILGRKMLGS